MTDAEIAALATRLDRLNPGLRATDRQARAALIGRLIAGAAEPATTAAKEKKAASPKAAGPKKAASSGVEAAKRVLQSKAMGARKAVKA